MMKYLLLLNIKINFSVIRKMFVPIYKMYIMPLSMSYRNDKL